MDELLQKLAIFNITRDEKEFDTDIDDIITLLSTHQLEDHDYQWNKLCENYSKLKYLDNIIKNYYIPESDKFLLAIEKFMQTINKVNTVYTKDINWYQDEHPDCVIIKSLLDQCLDNPDPLTKLSSCVKAYSLLIPIIENIRNENYKKYKISEDCEFVEEFNFKRRKLT
jgi:hypothetical protein